MIRYAQEFPGIAENSDKYFFNFWNSVVLHRHIGKRQIAVSITGKGNQFTKNTKKKKIKKKKKISDSLFLFNDTTENILSKYIPTRQLLVMIETHLGLTTTLST